MPAKSPHGGEDMRIIVIILNNIGAPLHSPVDIHVCTKLYDYATSKITKNSIYNESYVVLFN